MLEFLISLLIFVFGLGSVDYPALDPQEIVSRIEQYISDVASPQGDPESSYKGNQEIADHDPELPEEDQENNQDPQDEDNSQGNDGNEENQENSADPDTTQVSAYNTSSGMVIESVAAVAVENAPPLVSCIDNPDCEGQQAPQDEPTPTPTPSPIIIEFPPKPPFGCPPPPYPPYILGGGITPQAPCFFIE